MAGEVTHAATAVLQDHRTAWWQLVCLCQITAWHHWGIILEVGGPGSPRTHHSAISGDITVAVCMSLGRTLYRAGCSCTHSSCKPL